MRRMASNDGYGSKMAAPGYGWQQLARGRECSELAAAIAPGVELVALEPELAAGLVLLEWDGPSGSVLVKRVEREAEIDCGGAGVEPLIASRREELETRGESWCESLRERVESRVVERREEERRKISRWVRS